MSGKKCEEEERFLSAQADTSQERRARKSRPAPLEMTDWGGEKQIPHSVRDDSRGSGEMFPATVPALKSSHDPSTSVGMTGWGGREEQFLSG
jgi:hypothetical protein